MSVWRWGWSPSSSTEDIHEDVAYLEKFDKDLGQLFQLEEDQVAGTIKVFSAPPLNQKEIQQNLHSILEDCEITLG